MKQLLFLALFISCFLTSNVLDDLIIKKNPTINMILIELLASGLREETSSTKYSESLPKEICLAGGVDKYICTGVGRNRAPKNIAEGICLAGGVDKYICTGVGRNRAPKNIAEGICLAGGVDKYICTGTGLRNIAPKNIAEGICLAGGVDKYICTGTGLRNIAPKNIEEAIDMIPYKDRNYWWDRFKDQYGNYQWRCRGGQTKQFAENSKCSGVSKDDDRWPG